MQRATFTRKSDSELRLQVWDTQGHVTVQFRDQTGVTTHVEVGMGDRLGDAFGRYSRQVGVAANALRFLLDGHRVGADETARTLQLRNMDQIDVLLEQRGD